MNFNIYRFSCLIVFSLLSMSLALAQGYTDDVLINDFGGGGMSGGGMSGGGGMSSGGVGSDASLNIDFSTKSYVGKSQFFDLTGSWVNASTEQSRLSRLDVRSTIVNTYRALPYVMLGDNMFPVGTWVPLSISEKDFAYKVMIAEATCLVMPMVVKGEQQLLVYSLIVDPSGAWTGKVEDVLVREGTNQGFIAASFNNENLVGYWINEWEEDQIITNMKIENLFGDIVVTPYRIMNSKSRELGNFTIKDSGKDDDVQIATWQDGHLTTTFFVRPILVNYQLQGIDMVVEEIYSDGVPKNIFRQFFVRDPNAQRKLHAESIIASLEGEWLNLNEDGATHKILINDGDMEIFVQCDNDRGMCPLGKKMIKDLDSGLVGIEIKTFATMRIDEIETDLDANNNFRVPQIIAVNTTINDLEGFKPPVYRTEIFMRKGISLNGIQPR